MRALPASICAASLSPSLSIPFSRFDTLEFKWIFSHVFINELNQTDSAFAASIAFKSRREIHFILIGLIYTHLWYLFMEFLDKSNRIWQLLSLSCSCFFVCIRRKFSYTRTHTLFVHLFFSRALNVQLPSFHLEREKKLCSIIKRNAKSFRI